MAYGKHKYKPTHLAPKKKHEWSKVFSAIVAGVLGVYGVWCGIKYYQLCKLAIESGSMVAPDPTLAVTAVTVVISSLLSYLIYQWGLKSSLNKHHLMIDSAGLVKKINPGTVAEVLDVAQTVASEIQNTTQSDSDAVG